MIHFLLTAFAMPFLSLAVPSAAFGRMVYSMFLLDGVRSKTTAQLDWVTETQEVMVFPSYFDTYLRLLGIMHCSSTAHSPIQHRTPHLPQTLLA